MKGLDASPMPRRTLGSQEAGRLARALAGLGGADTSAPDEAPARIAGMPVLRRLGAGAMGEVFEAEQTAPRRRIALKVLRADLPAPGARSAAAALEREIEILGRLEHPGIARIYTAGVACVDGVDRPWFAMELVEGRPITELAAGLPQRRRLELMRAVCAAVQHAHEAGVIHLDLKPSNVLVDRRGQVRILDFGIARMLGVAAPALRAGTPGFAAPEQLAGAEVDERTDVFGLGALLRAMTAEAPGAAPAQLEAVIAKATAAAPPERYQTAEELGTDLWRLLAHRPVRAQRAPVALRGSLLLRRRRGPIGLGAAAVAVGVAGGSLWLVEAQRASGAERALSGAQAERQLAEDRAHREAALAEQERRTAESQAALARFSAELLKMSQAQAGSRWLTSAGASSGDTIRAEFRDEWPIDAGAMAEIVRLQSALLADPANEMLREELRRRAMALVTGGLPLPEPPEGARSFQAEGSGRWTETIRPAE